MTRAQIEAAITRSYELNPFAIVLATLQIVKVTTRQARQGDPELLRKLYADLVCVLLGVS